MNKSFLGTAAPTYAELTLVLEIAMGVGLLIGAQLARLRRYRWHAWCQSLIVLLNLVLIALTMIPAFHRQVFPKLPSRVGKLYYALPATHAALGGIAAFGGVFILLAAGTEILPEKLRMKRYKFWMRSVLVVWWTVLLLGIATYARWYVTWR